MQATRGLNFSIAADDALFAQAMQKMDGQSAQAAARVNGNLGGISSGIGGIIGKVGVLGPLLGGLSVAALSSGVKKLTDEIIELGDQSKTAGVSFEAFQEIKFAADINNVGIDALTDGLKEMQLRIDEFVDTGKGPATDALKQLGFTAIELRDKLKKPDRLFEDLIDRIKKFDQASQIRLADELFGGTAAEQFARFTAESAENISDMRDEARSAGIVIKQELLEQTEDINREWARMTTLVGTGLKRAVLDVLTVTHQWLQTLKQVDQQQESGLVNQLRGIEDRRKNIQKSIESSERRLNNPNADAFDRFNNQFVAGNIDQQRKKLKALREQEQIIRQDLSRRNKIAGVPDEPFTLPPAVVIEDKPGKPDKPSRSSGSRSKSTSTRNAAAEAAKREADQVSRVLEALKFEEEQLGRNDTEKRVHNELRRAGIGLATKDGQAIAAYVQRIEAEEQALERLNAEAERRNELLEESSSQIEGGLQSLKSGILEGKKGIEILGDVALQVFDDISNKGIKQLSDALVGLNTQGGGILGGGGLLGGLFSSLFGGGGGIASPSQMLNVLSATGGIGLYAKGGISNGPGIFGEAGPEAAVPLPDGRSIPVSLSTPPGFDAMMGALQGLAVNGNSRGGGTIRIEAATAVDSTGNISSFVKSVSSDIADQRIQLVEQGRAERDEDRHMRIGQ